MALTKASFRVSDLISDLVLREKIKHQILEVYKIFFINSGNQSFPALLREIDILDHYFYLGGHLNLIKEEHLKQLRNGFLVFKSHIILLNNNTNETNKNTRMTRIVETEFPLGNSGSKDEEIDVRRQEISDEEISDVGRRIKFSNRQEKILKKFQGKETLKLEEILEIFPDVSERTIRNELTSLINLGKITRDGRGNGSFYKIIDS